ncbi:MAG: hypothetical protein JHC96_05865 [Brevundimonas sp.]|uniref:hypothetical protein n=1 Tax=Brevundimonas sp. TaxID=1871086 RepID=UPI001A30E2F7|nr:hypothetical protein [Brevundimonas sp.]MBJ7318306.1 hypothetical protein [Brevundimonas sp.]
MRMVGLLPRRPGVIAVLMVSTVATPMTGWAQTVPPAAPADGGWTTEVTAYGWLSAVKGEIGLRDLPQVDIDNSALDALEDVEAAFMATIAAQRGDWLFIGDASWSRTSDDFAVGRQVGVITFTHEQLIGSAVVGRRLPVAPPEIQMFATVGLRYQRFQGEVGVDPESGSIQFRAEGTQDWIDPTVGFVVRHDFDRRWYYSVIADVGGFGAASDLTAQIVTQVGYRFNRSTSLTFGYRNVFTNYDHDDILYHVAQGGLVTGLSRRF